LSDTKNTPKSKSSTARSGSEAKKPANTKSTTKKAAANSAAASRASKAKSAPKHAAPQRQQRRELWVLWSFLLTILFSLAVFGVEGFLIDGLRAFLRGLFGHGSFLLPFAALTSCLIILFARGKPVAMRLSTLAALPILGGGIVHLLFCKSDYTLKTAILLYDDGMKLASGGLIAGGLAQLFTFALSRIGALIVLLLLTIAAVLMLCQIRLEDIVEFFVAMRDEREILRAEQEAKDAAYYEEERARRDAQREAAREERAAKLQEAQARADAARVDAARQSAQRPAQSQPAVTRELTRQEKAAVKAVQKAARRLPPDLPLEAVMPVLSDQPGRCPEPARVPDPVVSPAPAAAPPEPTPAPMPEAVPTVEPAQEVPAAEPVLLRDLRPQVIPQAETQDPEEIIAMAPIAEPVLPDPQPVIVEPDLDFDEDYDPDEDEFIPMAPMGSVREIPGTEENPIPADDDEPPFDLEDPPAKVPAVAAIDHAVRAAQSSATPVPAVPADLEVVDTHMMTTERGDATAAQSVGVDYEFPPLDFLKEDEGGSGDDATEELRMRSATLTDTLSSFGVEARIVGVIRGPSVTRYEMQLDRGVKLSRITNLQNDIALALGASGVRIAPIPDKSAVGIEVPNKVVQFVYLRDVLTSANMAKSKSKITFALGKDITGDCVVADIGKMPHLLIAGTTGSGKSVCINSIIISLLYRAAPSEVRLIMIDPKMVELGNYNGIPHLLIPVVTDHKKASGALNWAVIEMERRYKLMSEAGARDLATFNKIMESHGEEKLPQIVIIIDELADLMMVAAKEVEESICRIAQKARAAGMHLIIATQRPSADVLTGLMKSNIPSRIAFAVSSQMESRIILDTGGADKLIGRGDMLFMPIGSGKPTRVQGCFLSGDEIESVVEFIKAQGQAEYSQEILDHLERATAEEGGGDMDDDEADPMLGDAIDVVMETGQASASMLQRRLKLGYARAARIIDQMEARGIVGGYDGARPRQIQITKADWQEMKMRYGVRS